MVGNCVYQWKVYINHSSVGLHAIYFTWRVESVNLCNDGGGKLVQAAKDGQLDKMYIT